MKGTRIDLHVWHLKLCLPENGFNISLAYSGDKRTGTSGRRAEGSGTWGQDSVRRHDKILFLLMCSEREQCLSDR